MKIPIQPILELKDHPDGPEKSVRGIMFDQLQNLYDHFDFPSTDL